MTARHWERRFVFFVLHLAFCPCSLLDRDDSKSSQDSYPSEVGGSPHRLGMPGPGIYPLNAVSLCRGDVCDVDLGDDNEITIVMMMY